MLKAETNAIAAQVAWDVMRLPEVWSTKLMKIRSLRNLFLVDKPGGPGFVWLDWSSSRNPSRKVSSNKFFILSSNPAAARASDSSNSYFFPRVYI